MDKPYIIVGMGEVLWDMLPEGRKIGGAPANFAYHVSQFALPSYVVSAVGRDMLGDEIMENLRSKAINHLIERTDSPTGTVMVEVDSAGIPRYDITEDVAWDHIPYTSEIEKIARRTVAVCFGSLAQRCAVSRDTIGRFLDAMPDTPDTLKVFDVNLRQDFYDKDVVEDSLNRCNVLKINDEEIDLLGCMFGFQGISMQDKCWLLLGKYNLKILILTCGTRGSYVFIPGEMYFRPTPAVKVEDTVGAGDSFTASFISGILKGKTVPEAHRLAVETSAFVCSNKGAMPELPTSLTSL